MIRNFFRSPFCLWLVLLFWLAFFMAVILQPGCLGRPKTPSILPDTSDFLPNAGNALAPVVRSISIYPFLGVAGVVGAIFIAVLGFRKIGMALAAASMAAIGLSMALVKYGGFLAFMSLLGVVLAAVAALFRNKKTIDHLVIGLQNAKSLVSDPKQVSRIAREAQDSDTEKLVLEVKNKLKKRGKLLGSKKNETDETGRASDGGAGNSGENSLGVDVSQGAVEQGHDSPGVDEGDQEKA